MDVLISNLVKTYGKICALENISLQIGSGMFGLLGPNGAGKTTLLRIITTLLSMTSGQVTVDGHDVLRQPDDVRRQLGYLPQEFGFYKSLNAYELLDYVGIIKGLKRSERRRQIEALLEQVHLTHEAKRRIGQYSGGMKQRLGIAQALIGNPRLLVVDEPTAGLDPEERIRFRNLLAHLSERRTVILSTHIVADIEVSCTQVAVLNHGRLAFSGTPSELAAQAQDRVWQLDINPDEYDALEQCYTITSTRLSNGCRQVRVLAPENPWGRGLRVTPDLEEGYLSVIASAARTTETAHA